MTAKPELVDSFDPVSEEVLRNFELRLGNYLPVDYRSFLLNSNGGSYRDEVCDDEFTSVTHFFGVPPKELRGRFNDLLHEPFFDEDETLLTIGNNGLGDQILLKVNGDKYGAVFIHHMDFDPDDDETTIRPLAPNFADFLNSLHLHPDRELSKESNPLFRAIADADEEEFFRLFRAEDIAKRSDEGWPLVSFAAWHCRLRIVKHLLEHGADIEATETGGRHETPLFFAVRGQTVDSPKLLVAHGANVNAINSKGDSVLMTAIGIHNTRAALLLIECSADVDYQSPSGKTVKDCCRTNPFVLPFLEKQEGT